MIEILWHGRGGQGAFTAAKLLGAAFSLKSDTSYSIAFPSFGPERRGAPIRAFTKLDTKPIGSYRDRAWNYAAVGAGHGTQWWKEFFSVVRMSGYDEDVALEMEDLTLSMLDGHLSSLRTLKEALVSAGRMEEFDV